MNKTNIELKGNSGKIVLKEIPPTRSQSTNINRRRGHINQTITSTNPGEAGVTNTSTQFNGVIVITTSNSHARFH